MGECRDDFIERFLEFLFELGMGENIKIIATDTPQYLFTNRCGIHACGKNPCEAGPTRSPFFFRGAHAGTDVFSLAGIFAFVEVCGDGTRT